jgi:4-carboxymuconolactone decarboxylase
MTEHGAGLDPAELDPDGLAVRRAVLGAEHVRAALAGADEFSADFQRFITRYAWGGVWTRDGLDRRTRSAITLAVLTALHCTEELPMHVRGALANGLTAAEIAEVLLHTGIYAGVPAANSAFAVAGRALEAFDGPGTDPGYTPAGADDHTGGMTPHQGVIHQDAPRTGR